MENHLEGALCPGIDQRGIRTRSSDVKFSFAGDLAGEFEQDSGSVFLRETADEAETDRAEGLTRPGRDKFFRVLDGDF